MLKTLDITKLNDTLANVSKSLGGFVPELALCIGIVLLIALSLVIKGDKTKWLLALGIAVFTFVFIQSSTEWHITTVRPLFGMLQTGQLPAIAKSIFSLAGILALILSFYAAIPTSKIGEYVALILSLALGAFLLVMSTNLLMIYLAIELISLSSYMLAAFGFNKQSTEAAMKYVLFGGVASGIMLFGMSLLYGLSGTLSVTSPEFITALQQAPGAIVIVSLLMVVSGFLFKISSAPFHIWAPDVYEAAPTPVVAFFSVVPKIAGILVLVRILPALQLDITLPSYAQPVSLLWQNVLAVVAMVTMTVGNFSALWQSNAKRMLAYSSIAHSGFLLVGIVTYSELGISSFLFYAVVYLLMNFGAFLLVQLMARQIGTEDINAYKGIGRTAPLIGVLFLVVMISLTGLPPTAGFMGKFLVFSALLEAYKDSGNNMLMLLFLFGLFNTVVALFYYLKIPYFMFFKQQDEELSNLKDINGLERGLGTFLAMMLLLLFFRPEWLTDLLNSISFVFYIKPIN